MKVATEADRQVMTRLMIYHGDHGWNYDGRNG